MPRIKKNPSAASKKPFGTKVLGTVIRDLVIPHVPVEDAESAAEHISNIIVEEVQRELLSAESYEF